MFQCVLICHPIRNISVNTRENTSLIILYISFNMVCLINSYMYGSNIQYNLESVHSIIIDQYIIA